jgi:anti-anti-sigma regulatory factor
MNCKIDTRETFDIITPINTILDSKLADEVSKLIESSRENDKSVILNFENIVTLTIENIDMLNHAHESMYTDNFSFVLCEIKGDLKNKIHENELDEILNITPTLIEAIDIVSMEDVERELLGGE